MMLSACMCIATFTMPTIAQQAPGTTASQEPTLQEVIVTGSRIPVPANISATSPITVVSSEDVKLSGFTDTIDVLNSLPQNVISGNVDFGNQSSPLTSTGGFATVDLRGIGPQRTLVLVNGRRLGVGDPSTTNSNPAPDIDQIPAPLIERVDVVTGGASATYGSDAIAGVVNFIMKKNFEGIQIDGEYGISQHDQHNSYVDSLLSHDDPNTGWTAITPPTGSVRDGNKHDLSIIMGSNFADGNGNVTGYFVYHDQDPIAGTARDFSDCQLVSNSSVFYGTVPQATGVECVGSSNSNRYTLAPGSLAPGGTTRYTVVGNQLLPWPQSGSSPPAVFDFNGYEYLQREDKRYNAGFLAHDDLNEWVKPYVEFNFMDDKTTAQVAPAGLFLGQNTASTDGNYLVNCSNPLLSAQEQALICTPSQIAGDKAIPGSAGNSANLQIGRRNIEGGGRVSVYEHTNFRVVTGLQGGLGDAWSYDIYDSYYYVTAFASNLNYLDYPSISNALQVTTGPKGTPVCISGGRCVPYDIFTSGAVTPAQLAYLSTPGTSDGSNTEEIAHADVTGDLSKWGVKSPLARDGLGVNLGVEHRVETVSFSPDAAELSGNLAGFGGASVPTNANYHVNEAFLEGRAPIAQDLPGIYDLTADAGYRWSNYSTAGVTNTYKFEVQYAPIRDGRMRFSFDRAVRAPNLIELYNAPAVGGEIIQGTDPCAPTIANGVVVPATASLTQCLNTHVTQAEYGNGGTTNTIPQCVSGQCQQLTEGNAALKPEVATTWSVGFTLTPTALPGFTSSLDYYHIRLVNQINTYPFAVILNGCLQNDNPIYCSQINRGPAGTLSGPTVASGGYFVQQEFNLGVTLVSGIDLQTNYRLPLPAGWGTFSAMLNGAWVQHNTSAPYPGSPTYDCAHLFGSTCLQGTVNPTWRHNLRLSWETPWNVLFSAQWRFIGPTSFDNNSTNILLANAEEGTYDPYNARIPGYSYLDLATIWHATHNLEVRAGVNNVLDKDPPLIPSSDITGGSGASNSYGTYDLLGRQMYVAFTAKF
jgi:iron complex outermembrane receptor protein